MTTDPDFDRPGFNDLVTPFLFVRHGDPDPVAWKQAHPGWVSFPATFVPHKRPPPKWTVLNGKRWPLDKKGMPWPRSVFGQPLCPLNEYPPGVPAPGTQGKLQEAQAAALRETVELVGRGELTVEWFLAEGARHRAERDARAATDPQPPLAYAADGLEPARDYLAWSRQMNARGRGLAEAAGQRVGTTDPHPAYDGDGLGVVREHLAMMGKVDAYLREFAEGARQRTAARLAAADGITDAAPAKLDATRASSRDEQPSPGAPNAAGRGPILSDTDGTATHLPDGTHLVRIADRRTYYGPNSTFVPYTPNNQAFVRDTGRAIEYLNDAISTALEHIGAGIFRNEGSADEQEKRDDAASPNVTEHGQQRQNEARINPNRDVGDPNRVVRQGRRYEDTETGKTIYVDGDRVVVVEEDGRTTQFKNTRKNIQEIILSGKWVSK